ncbi:MAG: response regulator [Acidimicrobiia bacterium]
MARVLIVDDQPDTLLLMRVLLERAGYDTALAADAERACDLLAEGVDAVVVDIAMAFQEGWTVLRGAAEAAVPVVVASDRASPAETARAVGEGALSAVTKAQMTERLLPAVEAALSQ